jgi:predicted membrane protein
MPTDIQPHRSATRVILGLAIIAAGILFTLDNLHVVDVEHYIDYWPAVIILVGLVHLGQDRTFGGLIWSLVLVIGGAWILADNLGFVTISIWKLSPLLLVALGASIIWRAFSGPTVRVVTSATIIGGRALDGTAGDAAAGRGDAYIKGTAIMGAFERTSAASDFRGADLVSIMAGCKLDLRQAVIAGPEAVIDVLVIMGGVELRVPPTWTVHVEVTPLLGGVTDQTRPAPGVVATQRLVVRGTVFMGGVEIKD